MLSQRFDTCLFYLLPLRMNLSLSKWLYFNLSKTFLGQQQSNALFSESKIIHLKGLCLLQFCFDNKVKHLVKITFVKLMVVDCQLQLTKYLHMADQSFIIIEFCYFVCCWLCVRFFSHNRSSLSILFEALKFKICSMNLCITIL